jgi:hypothetical protein
MAFFNDFSFLIGDALQGEETGIFEPNAILTGETSFEKNLGFVGETDLLSLLQVLGGVCIDGVIQMFAPGDACD